MAEDPGIPPDVLRRGLRVLALAIKEQPRIFAIAHAGSSVFGLMTVASAYVLGAVTDRVVLPAFREGRTTTGALVGGAAAIIGVSLVKAAGITVRRTFAGTMQFRLQADYRRRVTRQYLRLPLSGHQQHPTGELLSNANSDVEATWWPIAPLPFACGVLVMLAATGVLLVLTDIPLALVGFVVFPAIAILNFVYNKKVAPLVTQAQELRGQMSAVAHESFDGALVVKTLGREADETKRFATKATLLRDEMVRVGRVHGLFDSAMEAIPQLGTLVVLLVGSARVSSGAVQPGEVVRVAYLFTLLAFPVRAVGWVLGDLPRAVVGYERVSRVLAARGALPYGEESLPQRAAPSQLKVEGVRFGYGEADVLHDVSFSVRPGRTVAIVGPTGAGKSTVASLLVRLVDPDDGSVTVDGVNIRELAQGRLSSAAALVPQHTFLFDDSVRGNITLGLDVPDEQVWEALRLAQAEGFVAALPEGLDTAIGERGVSLSGGQRQRLALARALVRRPRLLVLDDATSSVDSTVEAAILAGLRDADLPSTVVVVAYRRATIELADDVVFISDGRVRAHGPHSELIQSEPAYRRLVTAYETAQALREQEALDDDTSTGARR
jgi:ABC-type multidrug transport system fused ATPase/permease subunit